MIHLRSIDIRPLPEKDSFPFSVPVVRGWQPLELKAPVTFFVGENGSGKSSVLESIAVAAQMITVGAVQAGRDQTLESVRELSKYFKLAWSKRTRKGFFLRAEDFFGYVKAQQRAQAEMQAELEDIDKEFKGRSDYARGLAMGPLSGQMHANVERYGGSLDQYSHGESFLTLFQARFVPGGLYLLDEPEAPLSPLRQLTLLALLKEMIAQDAQFIIATHSPILMAFPGAEILSFDHAPVRSVAYDELEHVTVMRDFLKDPEAFLRHL